MYSEHELNKLNKSLRAYERMRIKARILTILTEASLRLFGLKKTDVFLSKLAKTKEEPNYRNTVAIIDKYATIFNQMNQQNLLKGRCLSQSLVMRHLLYKEGITSEIRIGIDRKNERFDAHAWLEKEGIPLNEHPSIIDNYLILPSDKLNTTLTFK